MSLLCDALSQPIGDAVESGYLFNSAAYANWLELAISVFAPLTGECAPVCRLAASISVEAVTPPYLSVHATNRELGPGMIKVNRTGLEPVLCPFTCKSGTQMRP